MLGNCIRGSRAFPTQTRCVFDNYSLKYIARRMICTQAIQNISETCSSSSLTLGSVKRPMAPLLSMLAYCIHPPSSICLGLPLVFFTSILPSVIVSAVNPLSVSNRSTSSVILCSHKRTFLCHLVYCTCSTSSFVLC